jgi:hypothetical protein
MSEQQENQQEIVEQDVEQHADDSTDDEPSDDQVDDEVDELIEGHLFADIWWYIFIYSSVFIFSKFTRDEIISAAKDIIKRFYIKHYPRLAMERPQIIDPMVGAEHVSHPYTNRLSIELTINITEEKPNHLGIMYRHHYYEFEVRNYGAIIDDYEWYLDFDADPDAIMNTRQLNSILPPLINRQ